MQNRGYDAQGEQNLTRDKIDVSAFEDDEHFCLPSPNWLRETLRFGFSPSNKIVLKGSNTKTISSYSSGTTSNLSRSDKNDTSIHDSNIHQMLTETGRGGDGDCKQRRTTYSSTRDDVSEFGNGSIMTSSIHSTVSSTRIIAPHVNKLSLGSVVEVLLEGDTESVAVLCSVDVLKMRSQLFQTLLIRQESEMSTAVTPSANQLWRRSLVMEQDAPYEGAAFLECLHDGRCPRDGEWSLSWTKLRYSLAT